MTPADATEVVPYLTSAVLIVYAQKFMKTRDVYIKFVESMPGADKWAHRLIAAIGVAVSAAGIHYTYMGDYTTGWIVHINIPDIWTVLHGLTDFVKLYTLQQFAYDVTRRPAVNVDVTIPVTKESSR